MDPVVQADPGLASILNQFDGLLNDVGFSSIRFIYVLILASGNAFLRGVTR